MQIRRFKDLAFFQTEAGQVIGFHGRNLDVAEVSPTIWQFLEIGADATTHTTAVAKTATADAAADLETWNNENDESVKTAELPTGIRHLSINVAQICNLKCTYCAAGGDGTYGSPVKHIEMEKALRQVQHFLNRANDDIFEIRFLGGEPLLYPNIIREIAQYARLIVAGSQTRLQFSVTTNATLINEKVASLLGEFNFSVAVSLDGDKATNDKVRPANGTRSSTELTLNGLKNLENVRHQIRALKVNSVFGSHNLDVVGAYQFLTSLPFKFDGYNFNFSNNDGGELNGDGTSSSDDATEIYIKEMRDIARIAFENGGLEELQKIAQFHKTLIRIAAKTRLTSYCGAGKTLLQTDTRHDLYTCNWFMNDNEEKIGQETTIDTDKWQKFAIPLIELNNCESCWARFVCGGGCMAVNKTATGKKHSKDPMFCKRTRELAATAIEYWVRTLN